MQGPRAVIQKWVHPESNGFCIALRATPLSSHAHSEAA